MTKKRIVGIVLTAWPVWMLLIKGLLNAFQSPNLSQEAIFYFNLFGWLIGMLLLLSPVLMIIGIILIIKGKKV